MNILKTIQEDIDSITIYRDGLLELLQIYIIHNKKEDFNRKHDFIKEIIKCTDYITFLQHSKNKIVTDFSNDHVRNIEEFMGLGNKKTYKAIT